MARRPALLDVKDERVTIAIRNDANEALGIARRLALAPEAFARAAPVNAGLLLQRADERLARRVREHARPPAHGIADDGRHEPATLRKVHRIQKRCALRDHGRTPIARSRQRCLTSATLSRPP